MKVSHYNQMMGWLTGPRYNFYNGGRVGFDEGGLATPKRGLVDEPGSYSQEKIVGTNQYGFPREFDDLTKAQKRLVRKYKKLSGKTELSRHFINKVARGDYTEKSLYDPQNPWMVDEKAKKLADAIQKANAKDKYINKTNLTRKVFDSEKFYFKGADKIYETLDTQQDKVDKVFKRIMESDDAVPKYINQYVGELTGITDAKQIKKYLKNNKAYAQNAELIDYLGRTNLVKTDLSDMSFRSQLDYAEDSLKGRTKFTGLPKGSSKLFRDANLDVMQFAKRNWDQNKGQGIIKFYNRKTGKEIKWKRGGKLALKGVSFTYGKSPQKYDFKYLRESGNKNPLFKDVYGNRRAVNEMLNSYVDNPFKKGEKIRFGKLMRNTYYEGFGYSPKTAILDLGHGSGGVKLEPFKGITIQPKRLNVALRDIDKIPIKGLKDKILTESLGTLKGKKGAKLINAVKAQQLDIAKQVAGGETFDKSLRLESTEKVIREGNLGPRSFSYALNNILKLKKDEPLYKELMKFCPTGKSGGGPVGSCSLEDATKGLQQEVNKAKGTGNFKKISKIGRVGGAFFGWVDAPIEFTFALPGLLRGDTNEALRNTTLGLFGAGGTEFEQLEEGTAEYKYAKDLKDVQQYVKNFSEAKKLKEYIDRTAEFSGNPKVDAQRKYYQERFDTLIKNTENIADQYEPATLAEKVQARKELRNRQIAEAKEGLTITDVPFAGDVKIAPYGKPKDLSEIDTFIEYKGDPFYGAYKVADEELRIDPSLQNTFYEKDIRDRYTDLPINLASQLGSFEKRETDELERQKKEKGILKMSNIPFAEYIPSIIRGAPEFIGFAGGGIAGVRRPQSIPPESGPMPQGGGLSSMFNRVRKW